MKRILIPCALLPLGIMACQETIPTSPLAPDAPELPTVTAASPSGMNGVVELIDGSGHYVTGENALNPGLFRAFTMHAQMMADGSVTGSFNRVAHERGMAPEKATGTISCFTVVDNVAWIGGILDGPEHFEVAWQVVDNGERKGADPDQIGLQFDNGTFTNLPEGFSQAFCQEQPEGLDFGCVGEGEDQICYGYVPLFAILSDIEGGNIQIKVQ